MTATFAAPASTILTPADPGWDEARQAWNLAVDQRPAAIARPASAQGVAAAVTFARRHGLPRPGCAGRTRDQARPSQLLDPQAYTRLRQIKAAVNPEDRIRSSQPIPPAAAR